MAIESFNCTRCGAPLLIRAQGKTQTVACGSCGSVLDAVDPRHAVLSKYQSRMKHVPDIPLGTRGKIRGEEWEAIGYMRRRVRYYGVDYEWAEYLLFNPYKGFRWLAEYDGHWTFYSPVTDPPK